MHDIFKEPSDQQTFVTLSQHRKRHNHNSQHHQDHSRSPVQSLRRCFIGKYGCDSCPEECKEHTQDPYCPVWCAADGKVGVRLRVRAVKVMINTLVPTAVFNSYPRTDVRIRSIIIPPPAPMNPQIKPIITPQITD